LGGQAGITGGIENFPGFPEGISGGELAGRMVQQARRFGVEILQAQEVAHLGEHEGYHCVELGDETHVHAEAVLIASGAHYRRLNVPGEQDYIGAGVHFCATCDGPFYKGAKEIVVVGGGNSALEEGIHLTRFAEKVIVLARGERLAASHILVDQVAAPGSRLEVRYRRVVEAFEGEGGKLTGVCIKDLDSGRAERLQPAAAFVFIGLQPNVDFVRGAVALDPYDYIITGHDLLHGKDAGEWSGAGRKPYAFETSALGVFAAGDVRCGSIKQVASAVGEGAAAAISIREYLRQR
jgi:thioredoxin reductase (NADPH)